MFEMKRTKQRDKDLHFKLGKSLLERLSSLGQATGRGLRGQIRFCLDVILPVAQAEKRYRLAPKEIDLEPKVCERHVLLTVQENDYLIESAASLGLKVPELLRQLLWVAIEFHMEFGEISLYFTKEEFQRRIREALEIRWNKIS